jgi:hypothetical protein
MRQHQILLMGDSDLTAGILIGEVGDHFHLFRRRIAGDTAGRL